MDISRFYSVHQESYDTALSEVKAGQKRSHWMWYIFPQIAGLGQSPMARRYAIQSVDEAKAFLQDEYLGGHLLEITEAVLVSGAESAISIFGSTDTMKLRSSMTLFAYVSGDDSVFANVLKKYFNGRQDAITLAIIDYQK